jgi:membrane protein
MTPRRGQRGQDAGARTRRLGGDLVRTARHAVGGFLADRGPQSAAAISYYALFSLFPLAILMVTGFSLVIGDEAARAQVIGLVLDNVPLREGQGRRQLEEVLTSVTENARGFGVVGALGLVFSASGVMGAIRHGLNRAWGVDDTRPVVQGKLVDILLVLGVGLLVALSFALTLAARLAVSLTGELEQALGSVGSAIPRLLLELGQVVPALVAFALFTALFRLLPATRTRLRDVWPGALVAALGYEATKTGFALYLEGFADYGAIYASLSAVVAFMVFVFITANLFLLGAEVAVQWPRARAGCLDDDDGEAAPLAERVRGALRGLFVRRGEPDRAPAEASGGLSRPRVRQSAAGCEEDARQLPGAGSRPR